MVWANRFPGDFGGGIDLQLSKQGHIIGQYTPKRISNERCPYRSSTTPYPSMSPSRDPIARHETPRPTDGSLRPTMAMPTHQPTSTTRPHWRTTTTAPGVPTPSPTLRPTERVRTTDSPSSQMETTAYLHTTDYKIYYQLELAQVSAQNVRETEMTLVQAVADAFETELFYVAITDISNSINGRRQLDVDTCFVAFVTYGETQDDLNKLAMKLDDASGFRKRVQTNLHNTLGMNTIVYHSAAVGLVENSIFSFPQAYFPTKAPSVSHSRDPTYGHRTTDNARRSNDETDDEGMDPLVVAVIVLACILLCLVGVAGLYIWHKHQKTLFEQTVNEMDLGDMDVYLAEDTINVSSSRFSNPSHLPGGGPSIQAMQQRRWGND